jgi:hypothetical protein
MELKLAPERSHAPSPEKVSNFINADSVTWNIVALEKFFIPMDAECICKIQLSR